MRQGAALTGRGRALLVMAVIAALTGYLVGVLELYSLAAAAVVLVLACRAWVGVRSWDLRASRAIRPSRVPAGTDAGVFVTVRNHATRRSPLVSVPTAARPGRSPWRRWDRESHAPGGTAFPPNGAASSASAPSSWRFATPSVSRDSLVWQRRRRR